VLDETLETAGEVIGTAAGTGRARVLASLGCFGQRLAGDVTSGPGTFVLSEWDTLHRSLAPDAPSAIAASDGPWTAWQRALRDRGPGGDPPHR
jgi:hypothetical protein